MVPNMKAKYTADVAPALMKKFEYESVMQIPKIDKVVINVGCGKEANGNSKVIEAIVRDVTAISGQKPIITHAKKSIANFKLREGMPVGVKVTLRHDRMWEFLDRLFNVALPRLPRHQRRRVRRPRQLRTRPDRAADLPGNFLRTDRQAARHEHRHLHHRKH